MTPTTTRTSFGAFDGQQDIGVASQPGVPTYDAEADTYQIGVAGDDFWGDRAGFHFIWKRVSGDAWLTAELSLPDDGIAALMIRQGLERDAVAAVAMLRPDGRPVLQSRDAADAAVVEILAREVRPRSVRLEKRGLYVSISVAGEGQDFRPAGGSVLLPIIGDFYMGLAARARDVRRPAAVRFPRVNLGSPSGQTRSRIVSTLEAMNVATRQRRVVLCVDSLIEAPNWSRDGASLVFNGDGRIRRVPVEGGAVETIDSGFAVRCNNDHGLSPDGRHLVISDHSEEDRSIIYVLPASGGTPRRVVAGPGTAGPSYWHGWSPDGRTLAYCAEREGRFGVFTIPVDGGDERRLTTAVPKGLDDGPDYSPDGRWIYFNSDRGGRMQIWRIHPDGSGLEQITSDEYSNWFAHPSPDGRWIVVLSYGLDVLGHPANKDVQLRMMPASGGPMLVLARILGGQGTINVPSWSPDSREIAYVSYQLAT
jgi:dipeptidyl aminopeptidase/acylaminoacyl peptidase